MNRISFERRGGGFDWSRAVARLRLEPEPRLVLFALASEVDAAGEAWIAPGQLAGMTGLDEQQLLAIVRGLVARGLVDGVDGGDVDIPWRVRPNLMRLNGRAMLLEIDEARQPKRRFI
jgi:hypothetical protein